MADAKSIGKVVIAGGTGFLGKALVRAFEAFGAEIVILSRDQKRVPGARTVVWDARTVGEWAAELDGAHAVINLAGAPVAKRWTKEYQETIIRSRVNPTRAIGQAIRTSTNPPDVWVNASAIGFYGDAGDVMMTEEARPATDFLGRTTSMWEGAATEFMPDKTRLVLLRIGIVLGEGGGAYDVLTKVTRRFLGGQLGDGRQWMSWIHLEDLVGMVVWAVENSEVQGIYNAVAPSPVTNKEFMFELRRAFDRPWAPPVPGFMMKVAEIFGGPPAEAALSSTRVSAEKALQAGYRFQFPSLRSAVESLAHRKEIKPEYGS